MNSEKDRLKKVIADELRLYAALFLYIRQKDGKVELFELNRAQKYLHNRLEMQLKQTGMVRSLILKGRQQGCSTYVGARFFHKTTHISGVRTFILTHEQEATANLFGMVERYYERLDPDFKPSIGASNRKELVFDQLDSGYRVGTAGTKGVGRSSTIQLLHGSEVAFWPHADTHAAGILQAVPSQPGTEIILESTANGLGNFFYAAWQQAVAGQSEYQAIFIPWYWQDEYCEHNCAGFSMDAEEDEYQRLYGLSIGQMAWRRKKIQELGDPFLFKQEYPATADEAFQTTGIESFIRSEAVLSARRRQNLRSKGAVVAGFDPARDGKDRDAFIYRQGLEAFGLEYHDFKSFPEKVSFCARKLRDIPRIDMLFIDYGGGGWEIAGMLREQGFEDRIRVVNFGASADNPNAYVNKRAEMYGNLRAWLYDKDEPPSIPDNDALHADLTAASYSYDSQTRIKLESKEDIKKRLLRSPDGADALALTFAFPIFRAHVMRDANPSKCKTEYDLFA